MHLWDRRFGTLPGPALAADWLQGGVRQSQTSQLWPLASRSSGETHEALRYDQPERMIVQVNRDLPR